MTSTGVIRAPGDGWVYNPETGQDEPAVGEVVYAGHMRVQRARTGQPVYDAAGELVTAPTYVGAVPWNVAGIKPGHTVEVTDSDDPALPRLLTIVDVEYNDLALTARRFTATLTGHAHVRV